MTRPQSTAGETKVGDGRKGEQGSVFISSPGFVNNSGQAGEEKSALGVVSGIKSNRLLDKARWTKGARGDGESEQASSGWEACNATSKVNEPSIECHEAEGE